MASTIAENENILLRTWLPEDASFFYELNADPDVMRYTGDPPFASVEDASNFIAAYRDFDLYGCGRWIIIQKASGEAIGWCGIKYHPVEKEYDLGFRLLKKNWNQGWASEAANLCLHYASGVMALRVLTAKAVDKNLASIRVLEKCGFIYLTTKPEGDFNWCHFIKTF
ncbi:MAG: GNAT family N-acetyltransferase [Saprospiraceae bacterium]|nr:GNAT family N-acetyltransferase [Saprospiraceae bacterium]